MGNCCKKRILSKILLTEEKSKSNLENELYIIESSENSSTDDESNNTIVKINYENKKNIIENLNIFENKNKNEEKQPGEKNSHEKEKEEIKEDVKAILIDVKEEKDQIRNKNNDIKNGETVLNIKEIKEENLIGKKGIEEKENKKENLIIEEKIDEAKENEDKKEYRSLEQEKVKIEIHKNEENDEEEIENEEHKLLMPYELIYRDYLDEKIDGTDVFDKKWYSDLEKGKIIYSKRSILAMIKAAFENKNQEFKEIYNKDTLSIAVNCNGSFLTNQFQVVRSIYKVNKDIYPPNTSIRMISKYLNYIKERSSWDPQIKLYKVIEGSEEGKEVKCIVQNWLKSPMFLVSERDIIEKRYEFYYEQKFYSCMSSVNDDYYPLDKKVTRINDIIFIEELYKENDNIILKAITQMNTKVNLPQAIMNATVPTKLGEFYKGLANAMNKDYENGKLIFEE